PSAHNLLVVRIESEVDCEVVVEQRREGRLDRIELHNTGTGGGNRLYRTSRRVSQDNARSGASAQRDLRDFNDRVVPPGRFIEDHIADVGLGSSSKSDVKDSRGGARPH